MRTQSKAIGVVCLAMSVAFAFIATSSLSAERNQEVHYSTAEARIGTLEQSVTATGTINPVVLVNVGSQVSGTVIELNADFNDRVRKGQVLLKLDPMIFDAQIRQSMANVLSAKASLRLAQSNFERNVNLVKQQFVSQMALDHALRELDVARANVALAEAQLERNQADLQNSIIRSPIDGVVIRRSVELGQTLAASFATPTLFQIANDLSKLQIDTNVSEADVGGVSKDQEAEFRVDAYPDKVFMAKIRQFRLAPNVTPTGVMYNLVLDVTQEAKLLKPGMTAQVKLMTATRERAIKIPTAALRFRMPSGSSSAQSSKESKEHPASKYIGSEGEKARTHKIFKVNAQNVAVPVDVTVGLSNFRDSEIVSGQIAPGDRVIISQVRRGEE